MSKEVLRGAGGRWVGSGNPGGRPKSEFPAEFRQLRAEQRKHFFTLVVNLLNLSPEESERRLAGPGITNYEAIMHGLIKKAQEGDERCAKFVLELALGKLVEEDEGKSIDPEQMRILVLVQQYIEQIKSRGNSETDSSPVLKEPERV